jgi:hypothetical protein
VGEQVGVVTIINRQVARPRPDADLGVFFGHGWSGYFPGLAGTPGALGRTRRRTQ